VTQLHVIFRYAAAGANISRAEARQVFQMAVETGETSMETWVDEIFKEGYTEGKQEGIATGRVLGREEGREEGALRQLVRVLHYRFGDLPEDLVANLSRFSLTEKEALIDLALDADTLDTFAARMRRAQLLDNQPD
jgi:predicted transposase YdaD